MSLAQGFPSTFSATQKTNEVLHNLDNETKKIYSDVNAIMAADGHSHTGNGSDGAAITHVATADSATTAGACSGNSATATILATARTIAGISFNGSANIDIPYSGLTGQPTIPAAGNLVTVLTGVITAGYDGSVTLPLPSGYLEEQCRFMSALNSSGNGDNPSMSNTNTRIVSFSFRVKQFSYIIVGVK